MRSRSDLRRAVAIGVLLLVTACSDAEPGPRDDPLPPDGGALFGAYVAPESYTDPGRISALRRFEGQLGRELDLVHSFHPWEHEFPSPFDTFVIGRGSRLLLSWAGTRTDEIVAGAHDELIRTRASAVRDLGATIMLRWRWEMNRPNLQDEIGSPEAYVAAWKHLRSIFRDVRANNVEWVWCPLARAFESSRAASYYPGDDAVDWLCTDAYTAGPEAPLSAELAAFLDWAAAKPIPIVLGEFATRRDDSGGLAGWIEESRRFIRTRPQIRAVVFYESDKGQSGPHAVSPDAEALAVFRAWGEDSWFNPAWATPAPVSPHRP